MTKQRREVLKVAGASITATTLAGCIGSDNNGTITGPDGEELSDELVIGSFGGSMGEAQIKAYDETFEEEYGVNIERIFLDSPENMYAEIQAGTSPVDIMNHVPFTVYRGVVEDVWQQIRLDNIPDVMDGITSWRPDEERSTYDPGEAWHHIPICMLTTGFAYNEDMLDVPDRWAWSDLVTQDQFEDNFVHTQRVPVAVANAARIAGYNPTDLEENWDEAEDDIWDAIREMDDQIDDWWESADTAEQALANGDTAATNLFYGRVASLRDDGHPIDYSVPEEGSNLDGAFATIVPGDDPKRYTAEVYLNWMYKSEEASNIFAQEMPYIQTQDVSDPGEAYLNNPVRDQIDDLQPWDYEYLDENQQEWDQELVSIIR